MLNIIIPFFLRIMLSIKTRSPQGKAGTANSSPRWFNEKSAWNLRAEEMGRREKGEGKGPYPLSFPSAISLRYGNNLPRLFVDRFQIIRDD